MTLVWEWVDIFLGRLRSIQKLYLISANYWELQVYDYCYINDSIVVTLGTQPEDEE